MFLPFFLELKAARVPVSLREYLSLLEGLEAGFVDYDVEGFYYLARAALVKDERHIDRFDQVFAHVFKASRRWAGRMHWMSMTCRGMAAPPRGKAPHRRGEKAGRGAGRFRQG